MRVRQEAKKAYKQLNDIEHELKIIKEGQLIINHRLRLINTKSRNFRKRIKDLIVMGLMTILNTILVLRSLDNRIHSIWTLIGMISVLITLIVSYIIWAIPEG